MSHNTAWFQLNLSTVCLQVFFDQNDKSEGAVDSGGPTREFFRLAVADALKLPIFCIDMQGSATLCRNTVGT
jgi:hypothetical protein